MASRQPTSAIALGVEIDELTSEIPGRDSRAGAIKANARVAESLFRKATGEGRESVIAAIFWLKTPCALEGKPTPKSMSAAARTSPSSSL